MRASEASMATSPLRSPQKGAISSKKLRILMVSDYMHPGIGGVEEHIYNLSHCLIGMGHKVVCLTHTYGDCKGVKYFANGLKTYYAPMFVIFRTNTFPGYASFPIIREILIRERIDIVHGHGGFSTLTHAAFWRARTMGYRCVFTDHSLIGFGDVLSIQINKLNKYTLSDVEAAICVSHTCRENTVLRAQISPRDVSVIPNAVVGGDFQPDTAARPNPKEKINIVCMCRLTYRKGVDLMVLVIPIICRMFPRVNFIIGGDGHKRVDLEEMIQKNQLEERVKMLGFVPHDRVREVLVKGHIFLNTSLTEAFCIAIVEAANCGLIVVSTAVGGVPEVLPPHMLYLAKPASGDIVSQISRAIAKVPEVDPLQMHKEACNFYSWEDVAARTEHVYKQAMRRAPPPVLERIKRVYSCGAWAGKLLAAMSAFDYLMLRFISWRRPERDIDICPDWPSSHKSGDVDTETAEGDES